MMDSSNPTQSPTIGKRKALWWGVGGALAVALIGALGEQDVAQPVKSEAPKHSASNVKSLQEAMRPIGKSEADFSLFIPETVLASEVEAAARGRCDGLTFCRIFAWSDPAQIPGNWPLLDRELAALKFRYLLNRSTGAEETQWFCGSIGEKPDCEKPDG